MKMCLCEDLHLPHYLLIYCGWLINYSRCLQQTIGKVESADQIDCIMGKALQQFARKMVTLELFLGNIPLAWRSITIELDIWGHEQWSFISITRECVSWEVWWRFSDAKRYHTYIDVCGTFWHFKSNFRYIINKTKNKLVAGRQELLVKYE